MCEYFKVLGLKILKIYFCPHHPNKNCNCRKPKPGLFLIYFTNINLNGKQFILVMILEIVWQHLIQVVNQY